MNVMTSKEMIERFEDMLSGKSMTITNLTAIQVSVKRDDDLLVVMLLSGTAGTEGSLGMAFTVKSDVVVQLLTQLTCALMRLTVDQDELAKIEKLDEPFTFTVKPGKYLKSDSSYWVVGQP